MMNTLPNNWELWQLADTGEWLGGGTPSSTNAAFWSGDIPWVSPKDMKVKEITSTQDHITIDAVRNSAAKLVPARSVLFVSRSGILAHSFPVATTRAELTVNQDLKAIAPVEVINHEYLAWALRTLEKKILNTCSKHGTTVHSIEIPALKALRVPIPPLAEQRRIILKIEELFSELDKGVESLKTALEQLKVYRQAVLKHALEGKFTVRWRQENENKLESPTELLERIKKEREGRYQRQLIDWKGAVAAWEKGGKRDRKPRKPGKPDPLNPISTEEARPLAPLPRGWIYARLGELIDEPAYGTSKRCDYKIGGIGVLRIPNVARGTIDAADLKYAQFDGDEIDTYKLRAGDILTIRSNGSVSLVGRSALITERDERYLYAGYLIRLRPNEILIEPRYLMTALSSHLLRSQIEGKAKSTSGVNNINSGELQHLIIPVCGLAEQQMLTEHLASQLSSIDSTEAEIVEQLKRTEALRHSILEKAFSGQLIAQDSRDEPASFLLARIRAEKTHNSQKQNNKKEAA